MKMIEALTLKNENVTLSQEKLDELENRIRGNLITSQSEIYDEARSVWNGLIDKRPALIVRCMNTGDVVDAINFAGFGEEKDTLNRAAYGQNYERLQQVKAKYDPDNFFCTNQNITPA